MNRHQFFIYGCGIALAISSISSQVTAKDFYKWVDAKGSTHYTTTPPPKNAKQKQGKLETHGWTNSAPYQAPTEQKVPTQPPVIQNAPANGTPADNRPQSQQPGERIVASPESKTA